MNYPNPEPMFEIAEFASFELFSPVVDETVWFFKDLLGMIETHRDGKSVYLRGYEDPYKHSLKITERKDAGMGFAGWRAMSAQALDRRVKAIEASGLGRGWVEGEVGHGPAYEFTTPDGAVQRLNFEVEYFEAAESEKSVVLNRAQRRPIRGIPIKKLDHLNLLAGNVTDNKRFVSDVLGFKLSVGRKQTDVSRVDGVGLLLVEAGRVSVHVRYVEGGDQLVHGEHVLAVAQAPTKQR